MLTRVGRAKGSRRGRKVVCWYKGVRDSRRGDSMHLLLPAVGGGGVEQLYVGRDFELDVS